MSRSMPPEDLQLLIAGYVLNDLDPEEAERMKALLTDPAIAQEIAIMQRALEATYAPAEVQPDLALRAAVLAAFTANVPIATPPARVPTPTLVLLPRWVKGLGAIAAAMILALSTSNYLLWRSLQAQRVQLAQETLVIALQPTDLASPTAAVVVKVNPQTLEGTLDVENLPPLAPGKVYVLWTVLEAGAPFTTDDKNAILTEVFTPDTLGDQGRPLILPRAFQEPDVVKAIAITIEDAAAPQRHDSPPLLIQQL